MLLGTFVPKLDEKGRIILPAKFWDDFGSGIVMTRGQERCLYVFSQREFEGLHERARQAPVTGKKGRDFLRLLLSGASQEVPDKQHRVTVPAMLRELRRPGPRAHRHRGGQSRRDLGHRRLERVLLRHRDRLRRYRRGGDRGTLLVPCARPSAAHPAFLPRRQVAADGDPAPGPRHRSTCPTPRVHVPVLLERTIELLAPALERPGAVLVDATLGLGGHAEAFLDRFPDLVFVGLDRDPDALERSRRATGAVRRPRSPGAHRVRPDRRGAGRPGDRGGDRHPVRPRGLLDAARPGRAGVRLRAGRAAGHADGSHDRTSPPPRSSQTCAGGRVASHLLGVRRREARPALRAPHRARSGS